jgi:hypothetical protein
VTLLTEVLRVTTLFGVITFMATYHLLAPWWRSEMGRNIMTLATSSALFLLLGVLQQVFGPDYPGQELLRVLAYAGIGAAWWWRWVVLIRVQVGGRDTMPETADQASH